MSRCELNDRHLNVYEWLRDMLIRSDFPFGEPIAINDVADRLRVSATPVREGLIRLNSEGFLDARARRGFYPKILSVKEMGELCRLVHMILVDAVRGLREVDSGSIGRAIEAGWRDCEQMDAERHLWVYDDICGTLIGLSHGNITAGIFRNASDRTRYLRTIDLETPGLLEQARRHAATLFAAVRLGDASGAVRLLTRDLDRTLSRLSALVKEGIGRRYIAEGPPAAQASSRARLTDRRAAAPAPSPRWSGTAQRRATPA